MSCNIPVKKSIKDAGDCKCHGAVMRAYVGLVESGCPHLNALEAAQIVYGYHHPEDTKEDQMLTVERWISEGQLH